MPRQETPKSRKWSFTLNNPTADEKSSLSDAQDRYTYCIVGNEVGESGTPHLQGFIYFPSRVRMNTVKSVVGTRAHVEMSRGTIKQNFDYCSKDGDFTEYGRRPMFQDEKGAAEKERYKRAFQNAKDGLFEEILEDSPDIALRHYNVLKRIRADAVAERELPTLDANVRMKWYYGPSGTGKSRKARSEHPHAYLKDCNKWWDGYLDQETVIIEDVDKRDADWLIRKMKIWADIYPFPAEMKGSKTVIRPKMLIVTSNYHPKDIWSLESDLGPILRRFAVTHFASLGSVPIFEPEDEETEDTEIIDLTQ